MKNFKQNQEAFVLSNMRIKGRTAVYKCRLVKVTGMSPEKEEWQVTTLEEPIENLIVKDENIFGNQDDLVKRVNEIVTSKIWRPA